MSDINKLIDKLQNEKLCSFLTLRLNMQKVG